MSDIFMEMAEEDLAYDYINEMARSKMDADTFGIPSQKKYPMPDAKHVKLAIRFFNHVDAEHEKELARNIKKKIKQFNVTGIKASDKNRFFNYYKPVAESAEDHSSLFAFDEQVIMEANIFHTIKEKIKAAIVRFIEMLERLLKKGKESKFKNKLLELLGKAKKNLTKAENMSTPKEAQECKEELEKEQKEFQDFVDSNKNNDDAWEELEKTKANVQDSISKRHEEAQKIIDDAVKNINKSVEHTDQMRSDIKQILDDLEKVSDEYDGTVEDFADKMSKTDHVKKMNAAFDRIDETLNGPNSKFDENNPGLREELLRRLRH